MDETAENLNPATLDGSAQPTVARSDGELVSHVCAGDETAFEELFNRHRRRVALFASRFFRGREQIEDVVQESFTKAYFALGDFTNTREASFAAWLARIAFNACYDELRRLQRRPEGATNDVTEEEAARLNATLRDESAGADIERATIAHDLADKLLSRLSPEDRLVLVMMDAEGMSVSEIAEQTSWSASKVKVRAHRARVSLRGVLGKFL